MAMIVVDSVETTGNKPVELTLDVTVPEDAPAGSGRVACASSPGGRSVRCDSTDR